MKKYIAMLMLTTMLISSTANAGILILTGDIGNKFDGYKIVGIATIILTGVSIIGLVVDENSAVDNNVKLPEISEASASLIQNAASNSAADAKGMRTVSAKVANQVLDLEGLTGSAQGDLLFATLTK